MKILITGGSGFIGSHLVEHYQNQAEVVVLDNFRTGHRKNLAGLKCELIEGSILDKALLDRVMAGVDYVFHLAALVSVPESMSLHAETVEINVQGLLNVLAAAKKHGVKKLCFASSAAVYGENPVQPKVETMTPDPRSPYGITKLDGEYYCSLYSREGWLETAALRFFNVFGPRQDPSGAYAAAVPIFIQKALAGQPITIFGDGGQTRDFIYVKDIVGALAFLAQSPGVTGVYNAGYGQSMSIAELARIILAESGSVSEIKNAPERTGDIRHSQASPAKLMAAGWKPAHGVMNGLKATLAATAVTSPQA
ncbi:MAG: NAD-dependent epimerase/dehydratase family protein [Opitutus sp.]|nr:NAD-dependent epimerase/dehydratase family protein [Opitutus sp.]MCS6246618.1 NAD-dependent epimerase/dehydratase family protein [Opitutus sp.]MCS6274814.1 NAD-dependent epimerase/dehydratase family protein [Opitutus sp.]MCS6276090.1 NAD-dependent epimerase/dehydratase family protein [Opitutus sp.]MCS6301184.1 NAD-dependent epimerase/dehydratase family protein [Opitutus sp.]